MEYIGIWNGIHCIRKNNSEESHDILIKLYENNEYTYSCDVLVTLKSVYKFKNYYKGTWKVENNTIILKGFGYTINKRTKFKVDSRQYIITSLDKFKNNYIKREFNSCKRCKCYSNDLYCDDCLKIIIKKYEYVDGDINIHLKNAYKSGLWSKNGISKKRNVPSINPKKLKY